MSVRLCIQGFDPELTGLFEEVQKLFGILHEPVNSLLGVLEQFQTLFGIRHDPVHELQGLIALVGQSSKPGNDVVVVRKVQIRTLKVKARSRHLVLWFSSD